MRRLSIFLISLLLILEMVNCGVNQIKPRLFRYTHTKTVVKPFVITSFIPSSCVQVEATLPPCRTLRSFRSFPSIGARSNSNDSYVNITHNNIGVLQEPAVQTTPLSWGEYLGIYAPTVTITATHIITTTVIDPEVQVTYAIKGCRPRILPPGMERCPLSEPDDIILPKSAVIEIHPTSTLSQSFESNSFAANNANENITTATNATTPIQLEGSSPATELEMSSSGETPTDGLNTVAVLNP